MTLDQVSNSVYIVVGHRLTDIATVLLTHAQLNHVGAIPTLVEHIGMPVYTGSEDLMHIFQQPDMWAADPESSNRATALITPCEFS